ncbi:MAG TPA: glycosyltransferase family 4 protein [Sphingomicrobium sp.]|nr:glycosyltransferase family 4 protein [Sphingomicrobium sp.]
MTLPPPTRDRVLLLVANSAWSVVNFRMGLICSLRDRGYKLIVAAPDGEGRRAIEAGSVEFVPIPMKARGRSPVGDVLLFARYCGLMSKLRPAGVLAFSIKPNIYASLAARLFGLPVINNVTGLGVTFGAESWLTPLVNALYKNALRTSKTVFFQNPDDANLFISRGLASHTQAQLLPGSGVDLDWFNPVTAPQGIFRFLLFGRLLWDKGIGQYVEAARKLKSDGMIARFQILGFAGSGDPASVSLDQLRAWEEEGLVEYLGSTDDVRPFIGAADCVVLPSYYREGVPKSLLEASAMAKPLITANAPGCDQAIEDGRTGYLCAPRSAESLATAMARMLRLEPAERNRMGFLGHEKMKREFSEKLVHQAYFDALRRAGIAPD